MKSDMLSSLTVEFSVSHFLFIYIIDVTIIPFIYKWDDEFYIERCGFKKTRFYAGVISGADDQVCLFAQSTFDVQDCDRVHETGVLCRTAR